MLTSFDGVAATRAVSQSSSMAGRLRSLGVVFAMALLGSLLLAASAHIKIPFWPVPMTLQVLALLLIGWFGGRTIAAASVSLYLVQGAIGLPVFAAGVGLATFVGPTGGYLFGFLAMAVLVGHVRSAIGVPGIAVIFLVNILAIATLYLFGTAWLALYLGDAGKAVALGIAPFLAGDLLKAVIAAGLVMLTLRSR